MKQIKGQNVPICIFYNHIASTTDAISAIRAGLNMKQECIKSITTTDVSDKDYVKHINYFYRSNQDSNRLIIIYPTCMCPSTIDDIIPTISKRIFVIYTHVPYTNRILNHGIAISHSLKSLSTAMLCWISYNEYKHVVSVGDHPVNNILTKYRDHNAFNARYYCFKNEIKNIIKVINKLDNQVLVFVHLDEHDAKDFIKRINIDVDIVIVDMYYRLPILVEDKNVYCMINNVLTLTNEYNTLHNNNPDQYTITTAASRDAGLLAGRISELMIPCTGQSILNHLYRLMDNNVWYYMTAHEHYKYDIMWLNPETTHVILDPNVIMMNSKSIKIYSILIDDRIKLIQDNIVTYEVGTTEYKKYTSSTIKDKDIYIGPTNLEHSPIVLYDKQGFIQKMKFHHMDFKEESVVL